MFRIEAFVDDKRLAQLLRAMTGVITGAPIVQPVANGAKSGGNVKAANSGELCDLFKAYTKKKKMVKFKSGDMMEFCKSLGMAEGSRGYVIRKLFECKAIKKTGKGAAMVYTVVL